MANEVRINVTSRDRSAAGFKSARANAEGLGNSTKRIGEIAAGVLASQVFQRIASAATKAFTDTIAAASNLNESINAVNVVFGSAADGVLAIGESSAQSMGLSQRAFNDAAVRFSAFAQTIAGEGGNVSQVVQDVTGRASDFASVMNIDVAQAMGLFQSGLAGESEPLRRYGIDISAAAVNTFAWANGIAEAGAELTEQEKVQARYQLIMEQTSDVQGDFANTSGDMANAQRILKAEVEDLQASMGQNLLPVLGTLFSLLTDVVVGFGELPGPVQTVTLLIAALTVGLGAAAGAAKAFGITATAAFTAVKAALGPISIALAIGGAIVGGLAVLGSNARKGAGDVQALADSLDQVTGKVTESSRQIAFNTLEADGWLAKADLMGISSGDLVDAWLGEGDALERVRGRLAEVVEEQNRLQAENISGIHVTTEFGDTAQDLLDVLDGGAGTLAEARDRIRLLGDAGLLAAEDVEAAEGEIDEALEKIRQDATDTAEKWGEAVGDMAGANSILAEANEALREDEELTTQHFIDAFAKRVEAAENWATNVQTVSDRASEDNREFLTQMAQDDAEAAALMAAADEEQWDELERIATEGQANVNRATNQEYVRNMPVLRRIAEESGTAAAEGLAEKLRTGGKLTVAEATTIMRNTKDVVEAQELIALIEPNMSAAARDELLRQLRNLQAGRTVYYTPKMTGGGLPTPFAHGGIVGAERSMQGGGPVGGQSRIQVHQDEVIDLAPGSRVIPSVDQAMDRGQAGGGGVQHVVVTLQLDGAEDAFVEAFRSALRVRGETLEPAS